MSAEHIEASGPLGVSKDYPTTREVLDRVADKWSVLVVVRLGQRTHRFSELSRSIEGISQRMLAVTVRALEHDGLVNRTVYPTVPLRVDYELTELGRTLLVPLEALNTWADAHRDHIRAARERHDSEPPAGAPPAGAKACPQPSAGAATSTCSGFP